MMLWKKVIVCQKIATCPISNDAVEETHSINLPDPDLFVNFSITLPDLSGPTQTMLPNSDGSYMVTCIGLNEDFTTTSRFELSQEELLLTRHSPPMTVTQIYPKAFYDSCVDDTVKVTWALSESDISKMGEYKFQWRIHDFVKGVSSVDGMRARNF